MIIMLIQRSTKLNINLLMKQMKKDEAKKQVGVSNDSQRQFEGNISVPLEMRQQIPLSHIFIKKDNPIQPIEKISQYRVDESLRVSSLFRKKERKMVVKPSQVSQKTKRLIECFLQRLNSTQNYSIKNASSSIDFLDLINSLNFSQQQYELLCRNSKIKLIDKQQDFLHQSPINKDLRIKIDQDNKKLNVFARQHMFEIYRKSRPSQSISKSPSISLKYRIKTQPEQLTLSTEKKEILFPYLCCRKREGLSPQDRHSLGVRYLKDEGRALSKSQKKGKIIFIGEQLQTIVNKFEEKSKDIRQ